MSGVLDRLHWARQDAGCCSALLQTAREVSIQAPQGGVLQSLYLPCCLLGQLN